MDESYGFDRSSYVCKYKYKTQKGSNLEQIKMLSEILVPIN